MKKLIFILFVSFSLGMFGQKYITKTGTLNFEASTPAFEPVKAQHSTTTAVLDVSSGKVAVLALVKGCLLYTSPSPRDATLSRMPSSA